MIRASGSVENLPGGSSANRHSAVDEQRASTAIVGQQLWITQDCFTQLAALDPSTGKAVPLFDTRSWTVKLRGQSKLLPVEL